MSEFAMKCLICQEYIDVRNDYYRELDCAFPNCPGKGYHEDCITKYLRKKGNGSEQKTGFMCPAVLDNGKTCSGTIRKTHIRTPTNEKKKEQSRQAAIVANQILNESRGSASTTRPQTGPASKVTAGRIKNQEAMVKVTDVKGKPGLRNSMRSDEERETTPQARGSFLEDYFPAKVSAGRRAPLHDIESDKNSKEPITLRNRMYDASKTGDTSKIASAIIKNTSMAPEPVSRHRVVPGWEGPVKPAKSTLEQTRAQVAALRAKMNVGVANSNNTSRTGAGGNVNPALGLNGAAGGAGAVSTRASSTDSSVSDAREDEHRNNFILEDAEFPPFPTSHGGAEKPAEFMALGADLTPQPSVTVSGTLPAETESPVTFTDPTSSFDSYPATPAPDPSTSPVEPTAAVTLIYADPSLDEVDPIVHHEPLFCSPDGSYIIQDANGDFFTVLDAFGPVVEVVEQEYGGERMVHIAVRKSFYEQAGTATTSAATTASVAPSADVCGLINAGDNGLPQMSDGAVPSNPAGCYLSGVDAMIDSTTRGGVPIPVPQPIANSVTAGAVSTGGDGADEGDDDLDDLLALCLGGPVQSDGTAIHA